MQKINWSAVQGPHKSSDGLNHVHLYPARHQAVCGSKDELLIVVPVWRGQDDLAGPRAISSGQKELLLGNAGRVHGCDYLDLLSSLRFRYNLRAERTLLCFNLVNYHIRGAPSQPHSNRGYLAYATISLLYMCWCWSAVPESYLKVLWRHIIESKRLGEKNIKHVQNTNNAGFV